MNKWINRLSGISNSSARTILGIMSGTSMDGIDVALCRISGSGMSVSFEILHAETLHVKKELRDQFGNMAFRPDAPAAAILRFQAELGEYWCEVIAGQLNRWNCTPDGVDLLASHGQTVLHHPDREGRLHGTWQIVDGDLLATRLGIPVVSDFRQKHIAAGFEGAPLAPLAEVLLFSDPEENRVLLNLGGIANFTLLERQTEEPIVPFATDCGPGNTLMDEAVRRLYPGKRFDENGMIARAGSVDDKLLDDLWAHPFFSRLSPKSTGQEDFSWSWLNEHLVKAGSSLKMKDLLATLAEFTASTAGTAIKENAGTEDFIVYASGGGWHNRYLIERLNVHLDGAPVRSSEELGMNPDVKEAVLFAVLANETIAGKGWAGADGEKFTLGKISLPGSHDT